MSWLSGWNYRKSKIINGTTAGLQTDYQMKLTIYKGTGTDSANTIYLNNHIKNDFSDIRFTSSDQVTLLNYWIESYTSGSVATIWIKIPSIPVSPSTVTIYLYYDNPTATSLSNGINTFIVYDDFNDGVIDPLIWSTHVGGTGGAIAETGGEIVHSGGSTWWGANHYTKKTFNKTDKFIIEFKVRYPSYYTGVGGDNRLIYFFNTSNVTWSGPYDQPSPAAYIDLSADNATFDTTWRVTFFGNGNYSLTRLSGTAYLADRVNQPISLYSNITDPIVVDFCSAVYGTNSTYYDNTIIRKYASPEPTFGSTGTEEIQTCNPCTPNLIVLEEQLKFLLLTLSYYPPGYLGKEEISEISKFIDNCF